VLLVTFLLMVVGFALVYAGVHSGDGWKKPWAPFVRQLQAG
jgi:hypothetical protein